MVRDWCRIEFFSVGWDRNKNPLLRYPLRRTLNCSTHQEVALFGQYFLHVFAKHCNLTIITAVTLEKEKKKNIYIYIYIPPLLVRQHFIQNVHRVLTGAHSSSASMKSSSSDRHSKESKYNHCLIGINFPVQAWGEKEYVKTPKRKFTTQWSPTLLSHRRLPLTFITSWAAKPPMKALIGAKSPAEIYANFWRSASSSSSTLADPVRLAFTSLASATNSSPSGWNKDSPAFQQPLS